MSIMDYVIGANAGKAQGEAIERSSLQDDNAHDIGMLAIIVATWKGRYEREQSARRGWQEKGMAARELIQKLTGTDKEGAEQLIAESIKLHQVKLDSSLEYVDKLLFNGNSKQ
jgi:hypothetical protein